MKTLIMMGRRDGSTIVDRDFTTKNDSHANYSATLAYETLRKCLTNAETIIYVMVIEV